MARFFTSAEAAQRIGVTAGQVRTLIRTGRIKAKKVDSIFCDGQYYYEITPKEVRRYADAPQPKGWPRGNSRKKRGKHNTTTERNVS